MKILVSVSAPEWIPDDTPSMGVEMRDPAKRKELAELVLKSPSTTRVEYLGTTWFNMKTTIEHQQWLVLVRNVEAVACLIYKKIRLVANPAVIERGTWNHPEYKGTIRRLLYEMLDSGFTRCIITDEQHTDAGRSMWLKMCEGASSAGLTIRLFKSGFDPFPEILSYKQLLEIEKSVWTNKDAKIALFKE